MSTFLRAAAVALLGLLAAAAGIAQAPAANARQLWSLADVSLRSAIQDLERTGRLAANPQLRSTLNETERAVEAVGDALRARDTSFFERLGEGSRRIAELEEVWRRSRLDQPLAGRSLATLASSYGLLRDAYGREGRRHHQGGGLTAGEQSRLAALQKRHQRLARELRSLEAAARRSRDRETAEALERLRREAERLAGAPPSLEAYLAAAVGADTLRGQWEANAKLAPPASRKAWQKVAPLLPRNPEPEETVESIAASEDVGFVFAVDFDTPTELPPGIELPVEPEPAPVQVESVLVFEAPAESREGESPAEDAEDPVELEDLEAVDAAAAESEAPAAEAPAPAEAAPAEPPAAEITPPPSDSSILL